MKKLLAGALCAALLTLPALAQGAWTVQVDTKALDLGNHAPYEENGHVMLPLRRMAEALGFTVTWDQAAQAAKLDNGKIGTTITIGSDVYFLAASQGDGLSAPQSFGAAPALVRDATFVPLEFFTLLYGRATAENGVISISSDVGVQMPNPMRQYDDLKGASEALGFSLSVPQAMPEGYTLTTVWVIAGDMLDLRYHSEHGDASFRMAKGTADVSGDYTSSYASVVAQSSKGTEYTLKGDGQLVSLVTWVAGENSFSLSFHPGVSTDAAMTAAQSMGEGK